MEDKKPDKKSGAFSKGLIIGVFIFLFFFIIACLIIFCIVGSEPITLITAVFSICGFEYGMISKIKTKKIDKEIKNNDKKNNDNGRSE